MLLIKTSLTIATMFLIVNASDATLCHNKNVRSQETRRAGRVAMRNAESSVRRQNKEDLNTDLKVLAQGSHSEVTNPFVAVARDPATYAKLRKLAPGLPELLDEFFVSHAAVAAFMGEHNTGGYSVEITRVADGPIRVEAKSPPKGSMVSQVITTPFKVVAVSPGPSLALEVDGIWRQAMRTYRITSGEFSMGGGFAGTREQFALEGDIRVMREGKLATFAFDLKSTNAEKQRALKEAATGFIEDDAVNVSRIGAGSLIEMPHSDLRVSGTFAGKSGKLTLSFASLPTMIADGYGGGGNIRAEATTPEPQKKQPIGSNPI